MCDPLTVAAIGGTVLSAAGTGYQAMQANEAADDRQEARRRQLQEELERQREFQEETSKSLGNLLTQYQAPNQEQAREQETQRRQRDMAEAIRQQDEIDIPTSGNAPEVVKTDAAKAMREATQEAVDQSKLLGRLGAYTGVEQGNQLAMNRTGNRIDMLRNFSDQSQALNQFEQRAKAQQAGGGRPWVGDALAGVGSAAASYGFSGAPSSSGSSPRPTYSGGAGGGYGQPLPRS